MSFCIAKNNLLIKLAFALLLVMAGTGQCLCFTASAAANPLNYDRSNYQLTASGEMLDDLLADIEESAALVGINITINAVGDIKVPVTASLTEKSIPLLIKHLVRSVGFLVVQRESQFTVYGEIPEDSPLKQNMGYVYELQALPVEVALEQLNSYALSIQIRGLAQNSAISFVGPYEDIRQAVFFLESIDKENAVVMVELLVVQYRHGDKFNWGIDVTKGTYGRLGSAIISPGVQNGISFAYNFLNALDPSFSINLANLVQDNRARVVTNPHIAVRNGENARISLTQDKYVNVLKAQDDVTDKNSYELKELQAGVSLSVTPTVTSTGLILLKVEGSLSVFVPSASNEYAIDSNTIETALNVTDGQTLIIGGMINRQETISDNGIPVLKNIPLIGGLFKRINNEIDYLETVVYITPHIYPMKDYERLSSRNEIPFIFDEIQQQEATLKNQLK